MKRSEALKLIAKELERITYENIAAKYAVPLLAKLEEAGFRYTVEEKVGGDTLRLLEEYEEE
jgi:protein involved in ribonucleotide reduction